jgi:surface antigen
MLLLAACGEVGSDATELEVITSALSPCDEMVPENRYIDGIPAYAQCPAIEMGAIFSNNGVDTSATKIASDWVRTQYSGGYQCTELAHRYLHFVWDVRWTPNGNAGAWCDTQPPANSGMVQTTTPMHGDLIVFAPGSCGAAQGTGHVAVVDTVDMAAGKLVAVEQNRARRGSYNISCAKCYLHVVANDGTKAPKKPAPSADGGAQLPPVGDPPRADAGLAPRPPARDAAARPGPSSDGGLRSDAAATDATRDASKPPSTNDAAAQQRPEDDDDVDESEDSADADDDEGDDEADDEGRASADDSSEGEGGCSLASNRASSNGLLLLLVALTQMVRVRRRSLAHARPRA